MFKTKVLFIATMLGLVSLSYGMELDTVTSFSGQGQPSGKFYYPTRWNFDAVFGFSSVVPARKRDGNNVGQELDTDILLGVRTKVIILQNVDIYFLFDNYDGVERTSHEKSDFYTRSLNVSKKWMFPLNEYIDLGIQATLAEFMLEGTKEVRILQNISPAIGVTIKIFERE